MIEAIKYGEVNTFFLQSEFGIVRAKLNCVLKGTIWLIKCVKSANG